MDPLLSEFADDPDFQEILKDYLHGLPDVCNSLNDCLSREDSVALRRLAHQIRGSGGGYGFQQLTDAGCELELAIDKAGRIEDGVTDLTHKLITLCRRAHASLQQV